MSAANSGWISLTGHPLAGDALVRYLYLDESGRGQISKEPNLIVAGIVVHADSQLKPLKQGLADIKNKYIAKHLHEIFFFHASELFNGGKTLRREDGWSFENGYAVASDMLKLLEYHSIPATWRKVERASRPLPLGTGMKQVDFDHTVAYLAALMRVDGWMKKKASNEVCSVIVENNDEVRTTLREVHNLYRSDDYRWVREELFGKEDDLAISHIEETVLSAYKHESPMLQIADLCCYIVKKGYDKDNRFFCLCKRLQPLAIGLEFD